MYNIITQAICTLCEEGDTAERGEEAVSPQERVQELFTRRDRDQDGCLTEDEYMDGMGEDHHLMRALQHDQLYPEPDQEQTRY